MVKTPLDMIIFGASGGIGKHLVQSFQKDHNIYGTYHQNLPLGFAQNVQFVQVDVENETSICLFIESIKSKLIRPVLIYAAGTPFDSLICDTDLSTWNKTMNVNLTGAMIVSREVLRIMKRISWGRIVYLSSVLARLGTASTSAYSCSKAALCALARVTATEVAQSNITANCLALGYFDKGISREVSDNYMRQKVLPRIPVGRLGSADNIVRAIEFIIDADYLTGATLDLNGGMISV